jgi:murein DD-endopeptidase MepM/ murein hydrolase activator NlpD
VRGDDNFLYGYVHIQRIANGLEKGKKVSAGDLIAYTGRTGIRHSKPHTHFQAKGKDGHYINPYPWLLKVLGISGAVRPDEKVRVTHLGVGREIHLPR